MMRRKPLIFTVAGLVVAGGASLVYLGYASPLPDNALSDVQGVHVEDDWSGYSRFSPVVVGGSFTAQNGAWKGTVLLSFRTAGKVRGVWEPVLRQKYLASTVPDAVMQKVFRTLQSVPVRRIQYKPVITHTDDYPHPLLSFAMRTRSLVYGSHSNTHANVPWAVFAGSGEYVTQSDAPYNALLLLRPYLHENELRKLEQQAVKSR